MDKLASNNALVAIVLVLIVANVSCKNSLDKVEFPKEIHQVIDSLVLTAGAEYEQARLFVRKEECDKTTLVLSLAPLPSIWGDLSGAYALETEKGVIQVFDAISLLRQGGNFDRFSETCGAATGRIFKIDWGLNQMKISEEKSLFQFFRSEIEIVAPTPNELSADSVNQ